MTDTEQSPQLTGWVTFAAILALVAGAASVFWGIGALRERGFYVASGFIVSKLTVWGWIAVLFGVAELAASVALFLESSFGRLLGVAIATLSLVFWFLVFSALPVFALGATILDVLVIYGLTARWEE